MNRVAAFVFALFAFFSLGLAPASAQGIITGKIGGTVADPTGAVIPGASVTALRASTTVKVTATSGSDGSFSFSDLIPGTYTLTIQGSGFAPRTLNNVQVTANRTVDLGLQKLSTGGASDTVEVSSAQNTLETSTPQVTTTFDAEQLTNLPTGGGFDELALLIPGVVNTHAANFANTNGAGISSNGQRGRSNNFELDGQSNNDNSVTGPQAFFGNDEALSEVQIITNNFEAEYGRNMGSIVNYITKSGTNSIHGSAIYRYSGDFTSSLDPGVSKGQEFGFCTPGQSASATGCITPVVPRYVSNKWGGTLGGPILKDKLFGFGSTYFTHFYEYGALVSSGSKLFPTPAGLATLASTYPNSPAVAILQQLSPYNIPAGNPRQTGAVTNETVSNGTTSVSIPFAPFGRQVPQVTTDQEDLGRIDYQITPKDRFYVRYFYQTNPTAPDGATANGGFVNVRDAVHSVGSDITHTFSPRWVDQLRYSFQQSTLAFDGGGFPNCTISNFASCPSSITLGSLGVGSATGLGLPDNLPQGRIVKVGQIQNNATWNIGRQSITFGGEFDYTNSPNTFLPNASGTFNFSSFNSFLAGGCATGCSVNLTSGNPVIPFQEHDFALYFQDDWKVTPSFTANLGLRYEFFGQALNLLHNETVAQQTGANPQWNTSLPLSQTTYPYINPYYKNIEPRIGFAFNPSGMPKLVIRGGYAINVDPGYYNINLNSASSAPVVNSGTAQCTPAAPCLPTGGATFATVSTQLNTRLPRGGNPGLDNQTLVTPNFRQPYAQTYTLGTEYQIGRAAVAEVRYTGNHTIGNFQTLDGNPYLAPVAAAFPGVVAPSSLCAGTTALGGADAGYLNCGKTNVRVRANTAFSIYNSVQTSLTTRNYHGVTATAAYTFSRTIDNSSEIFGTLGGGNTNAFAQNPLNTNVSERAVSGTSYPNVASVSMTYAFPKFNSSGALLSRLVGGWQANTVWFYNSGQPYNDFDYQDSQSPAANYGGSTIPGDPGDPNTYLSFSSQKASAAFNSGYDFARPILSNPKAPVGTLGIYTDTTTSYNATTGKATYTPYQLVDYATGAPITASQVHFIANNRAAAILLGNPYPGSGRNILRGNTYNNVDFSVFKNTKITERVTFRLEVDAYNVLNRAYYGTPDNYMGDYPAGSFNNFFYNTAGGSNVGPGTGVRNMEFGGKILF